MQKGLFREKSIEGISSPDSLNDYIRVVKPSVWVTLIGIIVMLIGLTVWSIVGHLDTEVHTFVISDENGTRAYVDEKDIGSIMQKNTILIDGKEYRYSITQDSPISFVTIDDKLPDGIYEGKIVIDSVNPISFVLN